MSPSEAIGMRSSPSTAVVLFSRPVCAGSGKPTLFQIECGRHSLEPARQAQLYHRIRDVGLDANEDRLRPAQPGRIGDPAEGAAWRTSPSRPAP